MPCPTPITVAAILMIVAGAALPLAVFVVALKSHNFFCVLTFLTFPPCWVVATGGVRLLQAKCRSASRWGWWLGVASIPTAFALIPFECTLLRWQSDPNITWFQDVIREMLAFVTAALASAICMVYASILLVQNADAYRHWRDAELHRADTRQGFASQWQLARPR